jgi:putative DNA primase/helicase
VSQSTLPPIRFGELAAALLASAESLVPKWLAGGRREGHEWKCGDVYGNPGGSCSVNLKTGAWADFQAEERGNDLLSPGGMAHGGAGAGQRAGAHLPPPRAQA